MADDEPAAPHPTPSETAPLVVKYERLIAAKDAELAYLQTEVAWITEQLRWEEIGLQEARQARRPLSVVPARASHPAAAPPPEERATEPLAGRAPHERTTEPLTEPKCAPWRLLDS